MERVPSISNSHTSNWDFFGHKVPRGEIVYFSQILIIYAVIICSIFNLTRGDHLTNVWITLLSSSLGYLLPNPVIKAGTVPPPPVSL